jgi:gas vesicle protein
MHPLNCVTEKVKDSYTSLRQDLSTIITRMEQIQEWELSEETVKAVLSELEKQKNEIKERMHNLIDTF